MTLHELEQAVAKLVPAGWYKSVGWEIDHFASGVREEEWKVYASEAPGASAIATGKTPESALERFREKLEEVL